MTDDDPTTDDIDFELEKPGEVYKILVFFTKTLRNEGTIDDEEAGKILDTLKKTFRPSGGWEQFEE